MARPEIDNLLFTRPLDDENRFVHRKVSLLQGSHPDKFRHYFDIKLKFHYKPSLPYMKKIIPIPETLNVEESFGHIKISFSWFSHVVWFLIPFCLFWNGIVFTFLVSGAFPFILLHAVVGVGLAWYTICMLVNKTIVEIDHGGFSIKTTPLYFPRYGSVVVSKGEFSQVYVREKVRTNKGNTSYSYGLSLLGHDGRSRSLPIGIDDSEQALFIKSKIETYLHIERAEIEGEYTG
jgi:hypothetical protein